MTPESTDPADKPRNLFAEEPYSAYAKDYIKELLTNIRDADGRIRHTLLLVITLSVVFFLARGNADLGVTVFGLRLENLGPLMAMIPIITAYTFLSLGSTVFDLDHAQRMLREAVHGAYPKIRRLWFTALLPGSAAVSAPLALQHDPGLSRNPDGRRLPGTLVRLIQTLLVLYAPAVLSVTEVVLYGSRVGWGAASFIISSVVVVLLLIFGFQMNLVLLVFGSAAWGMVSRDPEWLKWHDKFHPVHPEDSGATPPASEDPKATT